MMNTRATLANVYTRSAVNNTIIRVVSIGFDRCTAGYIAAGALNGGRDNYVYSDLQHDAG